MTSLTGWPLNREIATRCFGWRLHPETMCCGWPPGRSDELGALVIPDYSQDIAAAWGLVESYRLRVGPWGDGHWYAGRDHHDETFRTEPTALLAICRAALACAEAEIAPVTT